MLSTAWKYVCAIFSDDIVYMDIIGTNVLTAAGFWILSGLLMTADLTGRPRWMLKYKTQPGKNQPVDRDKLWNAVKMAFYNQAFVGAPMLVLLSWIRVRLGCPYKPEDLPSALTVLRDLAVFAVVDEIGFYYAHKLVHWGPLYKSIHKKHHEWTAPVAVVAIYAHPFEHVLANIIPLAAGPLLMTSHLMTTWLWYTIALTTTVFHHSGYHLPLLPSPEFHDFHHLKFNYNYGVLGWLDWLHGTDSLFRSSVNFKRDRTCLWTPLSRIYPAEKDGDDKQQ